jgi:hypothetical protein
MPRAIPMDSKKNKLLRGDDWSITVMVVKADGTPQDTTGWTAAFTLRKNREDPDPPVLSVTTNGSGADGLLPFLVLRAQTLAISAGIYAASVVRTNGGSNQTLVDGTVFVRLNVRDAAA